VAKAAMKQAGVIVAESMLDHGDFIKTFALLHDFSVTGNRVVVIANAGYEKTYAAERAMACLNEFIHYKLIKEKNVFSEWLK
jgi:acyl-CoA synthetase (NDP forming)